MVGEKLRPPYVVSCDAESLMTRWGAQAGYSVPDKGFFKELETELHSNLSYSTGASVELIDHSEIKSGMDELLARVDEPAISLDRAYFPDVSHKVTGHIDVTRAVNARFEDLGIHPRPGSADIQSQLKATRERTDSPSIAFIEDVIFSGRSVIEMANNLRSIGLNVSQVIVGIAIGQGVRDIEAAGIEVKSVYEYEEVMDEVCQRDFSPGSPMSGRTVLEGGNHWSAPYLLPLGDPTGWGSIPETTVFDFSQFCLSQSAMMWQEIEKLSDRQVLLGELPRRLNIPDSGQSVVKALRKLLVNQESIVRS